MGALATARLQPSGGRFCVGCHDRLAASASELSNKQRMQVDPGKPDNTALVGWRPACWRISMSTRWVSVLVKNKVQGLSGTTT
jgi:hypothetical protein